MKYSSLLFIVCNIVLADSFSTALGNCNLKIYNNQIKNIPEIVDIIKNESKRLILTLGPINTRPFSIYITNNVNDFYIKSKGLAPEWGIAIAKLNPDRAILKSPKTANISFLRFKEVIIHELNHIYMFRIPNYDSIPSWFKEGMAMDASKEFSLSYKLTISKSIWGGNIIPLSELQHIRKIANKDINLAYGESAAAINTLKYYYGENAPKKIIQAMQNGKEFITALEYAININYIDFQLNFENYLIDNYKWILLLHSARYIYITLPIILIVGFLYKKKHNYLKLKQWESDEELNNIK